MQTRQSGFTLIELLVVITLIAIASSVVTLAMRDPAATRLEQEAAVPMSTISAVNVSGRMDRVPACRAANGAGE